MKKIPSLLLLIIPFLGISQARFTTGDVLNKTIEIRPIQVTAKTAPNIPIVQLKNANLTVDTLIKALKLNLYNNSMFTGATQANLLYINSLGNNSNSVSTYLNTTSNGRVFLDTLESLTFKGDFVIDSPVYDIDFISPAQAKGEVYRIKLGSLVTQKNYTQGNYTMILRDGDYIYSNGTIWDKLIDNGRISALETSVTNLNSFTNVIWSNLTKKVTQISGKGLSTNDFTNSYKEKSDSLSYNFAQKVDKITGKGLSTNDFTNTYKVKVDSVSLKQNLLNGGTGFVKSTGGTISYDNSTYLTSSALSPYLTSSTASSTYATQTNLALKANSASPTFTGNVGIGTVSPVTTLNINKPLQSVSSSIPSGALLITDLANSNLSLELGSNVTIGNWIQSRNATTATFYDLFLNPNGGNVGIGTISSPSYKLDVNGTIRATGDVIVNGGNGTTSGYISANTSNGGLYLAALGTNQNIRLAPSGTGYNHFINNSFFAGNIGVGITTPQGILDVVSTTAPSYPFPRMTTTQVNALTGMTAGAWVFDTTTNHPKYYNGSAWVQL